MSKKSTTTKPQEQKNGVEQVIDFLIANKANIRGLVVSVCSKPGKKIGENGETGDGAVFCVDIDANKNSASIRSILTQGLANQLAQHVLPEQRGLFG